MPRLHPNPDNSPPRLLQSHILKPYPRYIQVKADSHFILLLHHSQHNRPDSDDLLWSNFSPIIIKLSKSSRAEKGIDFLLISKGLSILLINFLMIPACFFVGNNHIPTGFHRQCFQLFCYRYVLLNTMGKRLKTSDLNVQ